MAAARRAADPDPGGLRAMACRPCGLDAMRNRKVN